MFNCILNIFTLRCDTSQTKLLPSSSETSWSRIPVLPGGASPNLRLSFMPPALTFSSSSKCHWLYLQNISRSWLLLTNFHCYHSAPSFMIFRLDYSVSYLLHSLPSYHLFSTQQPDRWLLSSKPFHAEFPGGLVVRIPGFHCHGPGSIPGQGTEIPQPTRHSQKTKQN